jgi:hypothetical protein
MSNLRKFLTYSNVPPSYPGFFQTNLRLFTFLSGQYFVQMVRALKTKHTAFEIVH